MPNKKIHMIGQAHLDPVWLWAWTEGRAEALATSQSAVDRLQEYPDFQFTRGEAQVYRWIEEEDPALFAEIKGFIQQGRWHVVNGMIVQPDMNLPQGESFVRHFLLGKGYMRDHLGVEPRVAYCVDSFGHAATLPQIFKKCGCDAYVFMRPGPHEMELPAQAFWWQAPDGSRVLAFRINGAYTTRSAEQAEHLDRALQAMPGALEDTMCFFGVGDHGGGPTKAQIENIQNIAKQRSDELEVVFSSPGKYIRRVLPCTSGLPLVNSELYYHAVGCYAANSLLKRTHRQAECALLTAERLAAEASLLTGAAVPSDRLKELWWSLCFNQFHDILGGCTIKPGADDAIRALQAVMLGAREITNNAGRAIAVQVDTRGAGGSKIGGRVLLFNPSGQAFDGYVEYEPWTDWEPWVANSWGLLDEDGKSVEHQLIATDEALSKEDGAFGLCRLLWRVHIPAMGYRLYRFEPGAQRNEAGAGEMQVSPTHLQNEALAVELDPHSGEIVSCRLLPAGIELVGEKGWNAALVLDDQTDTWSHGATQFGEVIGKFGEANIRISEQGSLQVSVLVERTCVLADGARGVWLQELTLRRGEPEILVKNWLNWQGQFKAVKLGFDLAASDVRSVQHIPFGWTERPTDGSERAVQFWAELHGDSIGAPGQSVGLALLNDGKYSLDVTGSQLRQTILRCPPYAYHKPPHTFGTKKRYDWLDQGAQEFTLVVRPYQGSWQATGVQRRAAQLNLPPVLITQHAHAGKLPPFGSLCELRGESFALTALKKAESGEGYILRLVEENGEANRCELVWQEQSFELDFSPFEIKTLLVQLAGSSWIISEVNMLERKMDLI